MLDTYLKSDSKRSVMRILSAFASNSMLSIVGEYFPFMILFIVDFEIPDIIDNCLTEMFLSYMISLNNIFMMVIVSKIIFIILEFISSKRGSFMKKNSFSGMTVFGIIAVPIVALLALSGYNNNRTIERRIENERAELTAAAERPDPTATPIPIYTRTVEFDSKPEPNTNEMLNYLAQEAKKSAEEAITDEKRDEAVNFIVTTYPNFFADNETMEYTMYYGYYLDYAYESAGANNVYANLGIDTYQVVKYVYRGVEEVSDSATQENLRQIRVGLMQLGFDV